MGTSAHWAGFNSQGLQRRENTGGGSGRQCLEAGLVVATGGAVDGQCCCNGARGTAEWGPTPHASMSLEEEHRAAGHCDRLARGVWVGSPLVPPPGSIRDMTTTRTHQEEIDVGMNPRTGRPGPSPHPPRDGDKVQARQRINVGVRMGRRPHPNSIPCADCGHVWEEGERRHEYDHHLGYAAENHSEVESVCTTCHARRDSKKAAQTHCIHGHEFTLENTGRKTNGTRFCRECHRAYDRRRHDASYWRAYRAKRKAASRG